jgi:FKBP-type peptidyl-prolyl cis-trans isomerase
MQRGSIVVVVAVVLCFVIDCAAFRGVQNTQHLSLAIRNTQRLRMSMPSSQLVCKNALRSFLGITTASFLAFGGPLTPPAARAGIDVSQIESIKKIQEAQAALDSADVEYTKLPSGVSYREFRSGRGDRTVEKGKLVTTEMTIRCRSLYTPKEPGGVKYYDSKVDSPEGVLTWAIGSGELPPGLEQAMTGMKKGAIRRIEIPSVQVFRARKDKQLPLPAKRNEEGQRRFEKVFKTDATMLFEVLVLKIADSE